MQVTPLFNGSTFKARTFKNSALPRLIAGGLALGFVVCAPLHAANVETFSATLSAANEVPPNSSTATGMVHASYDRASMVLNYTVTFTGLSGPATMAHFHGPAAAGANAGVVVPFATQASPIEGKYQLTESQVADLMAGKWYANVHTQANKGGEIRGQLMPDK